MELFQRIRIKLKKEPSFLIRYPGLLDSEPNVLVLWASKEKKELKNSMQKNISRKISQAERKS